MSLGLGLAFSKKADIIRKVAVIAPSDLAESDSSDLMIFLENKCEKNADAEKNDISEI